MVLRIFPKDWQWQPPSLIPDCPGSRFWVLRSFQAGEPIAAVVGMTLCAFSQSVLPFGLAFAAGAMIYVVSDQIIPECHSNGNETQATFGVLTGIIAMLALQKLLG